MIMDVFERKSVQLNQVAEYREELRRAPQLQWLFFEITSRCNLYCGHCGSRCTASGDSLKKADIESVLKSCTGERPLICLTGGEPLMHPEFFDIALRIKDMGFLWGMTTNATLINERIARKLTEAGMGSVSVSIDGMEESHDRLRRQKGAWKRAVEGIKCLQDEGVSPQITTVIHQDNYGELETLYEFLDKIGITSWRPINVEPIGRACESGDLLLEPKQFTELLSFIREKRYDPDCGMEVTFGCSHYLGVEQERMVRDHYFLCGAGIHVASIRSNGDICACLDIENKPELVQGNIRTDDFLDIWDYRFGVFRRDRTTDSSKCRGCPERFRCGGDSAHTWDYEKKEPLFCYQNFRDCLN